MKLIFSVLCILAVITGSIQENKKNDKIVKKCAKITLATKEDVVAVMKGEIPHSRTRQCFAACWMKELEFMTPDNKINVAQMKEMVDIEEMENEDDENYDTTTKLLDTCAAEANSAADECAAAKTFLECIKREDV